MLMRFAILSRVRDPERRKELGLSDRWMPGETFAHYQEAEAIIKRAALERDVPGREYLLVSKGRKLTLSDLDDSLPF